MLYYGRHLGNFTDGYVEFMVETDGEKGIEIVKDFLNLLAFFIYYRKHVF